MTLTDEAPSQRLIDNHYSLHGSAPAPVNVERFSLSTVRPLAAPCANSQVICVLPGSTCDMSTLALVFLLSTGNPSNWATRAFSPGELNPTNGFGGVSSGGSPEFYFSSCSNVPVEYFVKIILPNQAPSLTIPAPGASYFFVSHFADVDGIQNANFNVIFNNASTVGTIFGLKPN